MLSEVVDLPVYFATPKKNDIVDIIRKSKRFFDTKVVVIDHLDYIVRNTTNAERDIANSLQDYKTLGQELGVIFVVVTHLRKRDSSGRPNLQDLKGSSSLSQDPECVILLSSDEDSVITVDVAKNKGFMGRYPFGIDMETGVLNHEPNTF
jgi:replicative DNA helicase